MDVLSAAIDTRSAPARSRQAGRRSPEEPYPGLRPFLDHESGILFGRDEPIREVIERLGREQFVAVIGGSGSGKSSLVRAGVVPELRSYGIKPAGDYWLPMVCTPGSNALEAVQGELDTPIHRFAWKFSQILRPLDAAGERSRRAEIVSLLRRDSGFARLVTRFAEDFPTAHGLAPTEARLLLVIDQFEELFHPSNKTADGQLIEDARLLIERVIDHFYGRHPQCYVVLTMRSEHLNDCAGFLELPDALNASTYLVRRLDEAQLREAIVGPAHDFVIERSAPVASGECPAFRFDDAVVNRLLVDTAEMAHDPDHLPLLQHVLSRTWSAALARCQPAPLPRSIELDDLAQAVLVRPDARAADLTGIGNTLRLSLCNQADAVYARHSAEEQAALDALLRRLAFKDPNTGQYSQQRVNIDARNRDALRALVCDGLIGDVNYLFWDGENEARVTLKVSHESFIRGWPRFRSLVDREAERFEEFMQSLRACLRWLKAGRSDGELLEATQLRRLQEAGIDQVLQDPDERARWFRLLAFVPDGRRLREAERCIDEFLLRSREVLELQQAMQEQLKRKIAWERRLRQASLAVVAALAAFVPYQVFVSSPAATRSSAYLKANKDLSQLNWSTLYLDSAAARKQLDIAVNALERTEQGRSGSMGVVERWSTWLLAQPSLQWLLAGTRQNIDDLAELVEPKVDGQVRSLLRARPWPVSAPANATTLGASVHPERSCVLAVQTGQAGQAGQSGQAGQAGRFLQGTLYVAAPMPGEPRRRAVLVTAPTETDARWQAFPASLRDEAASASAPCTVGEAPFWTSAPLGFAASTAFAIVPTLDHLIELRQLVGGEPGTQRSVVTMGFVWSTSQAEPHWLVSRWSEGNFQDDTLATALASALRRQDHALMPAAMLPFGMTLDMGGLGWRLHPVYALPLTLPPDTTTRPLNADGGGRCNELTSPLMKRLGGEYSALAVTAMPIGDRCLVETRMRPAKSTYEMPKDRELVEVAVYVRPAERQVIAEAPTPLLQVSLGEQSKTSHRWVLLEGGDLDGWLALRTGSSDDARELIGIPLTLRALQRMSASLVPPSTAASRPAAAPGASK